MNQKGNGEIVDVRTQTKMINCGTRHVQILHRIALRDICNMYNIEQGDLVEVYIRKVEDKGEISNEAEE